MIIELLGIITNLFLHCTVDEALIQDLW